MACDHNCDSCKIKGSCQEKQYFGTTKSNIKHIIGVMSGKGGVGKSTVCSLLANKMAHLGYKVGILDADITGPSIAHVFGLKGRLEGTKNEMYPLVTKNNIEIVSVNLLLKDENEPVVWRGPILGNAVKQFYSETVWGNLDYLFVDMPPGTGDVALTVFQSLPVDGIVIVSTPQDLVKMIVNKAFNMAKIMNVPVLGLVENMSYYQCPDCGKKHNIFGESQIDETAKELGVPVLAKLPIDPEVAKLVDEGRVEDVECPQLDEFVSALD